MAPNLRDNAARHAPAGVVGRVTTDAIIQAHIPLDWNGVASSISLFNREKDVNKYFLVDPKTGGRVGPASAYQLARLLEMGKIHGNSVVEEEGTGRKYFAWQLADSITTVLQEPTAVKGGAQGATAAVIVRPKKGGKKRNRLLRAIYLAITCFFVAVALAIPGRALYNAYDAENNAKKIEKAAQNSSELGTLPRYMAAPSSLQNIKKTPDEIPVQCKDPNVTFRVPHNWIIDVDQSTSPDGATRAVMAVPPSDAAHGYAVLVFTIPSPEKDDSLEKIEMDFRTERIEGHEVLGLSQTTVGGRRTVHVKARSTSKQGVVLSNETFALAQPGKLRRILLVLTCAEDDRAKTSELRQRILDSISFGD